MRLLNQLFVLSILMHTVFVLPVAAQEFSSKYMATFFVGDSGTQYFIKPLRFDGQRYQGYLSIDFTFRHLKSVQVPVNAKFSFINPKAIDKLDSLVIKTPKTNLVFRDFTTLFISPYKNQQVHTRFSSNVSLEALLKVIGDDWWIIDAWSNGEYIRYVSSSRAKKALRKISKQMRPVFLNPAQSAQ